MVKIKGYCDTCNQQINMDVQQTVINHCLRWYISYECPFCTSALEVDGTGFPPNDIRQKILAKDGEWKLVIKEPELGKVTVIKVLRQTFGISIAQAVKILKLFPNPIIDGTKTEMEWLKELLEADGIQAEVFMQNSKATKIK